MSLCGNCYYEPWESGNPITEEEYLEKLSSVGVIPTGKGPEQVGVGSPFRVPLPLVIRLCCLDVQICASQDVKFSALHTKDGADVAINDARVAVYQEAGLPAIGGK